MKVKHQSLTLKINLSLLSKISEIVLNIKLKEMFLKCKMSIKKEEIDLFIF